jgi:hypothetical protein
MCNAQAMENGLKPGGEARIVSPLIFANLLPSNGGPSVFRAPLRAGAAHIVRLGPIPIGLIGHCAVPSNRCGRTRPHNHKGKNVRNFRKLSIHVNLHFQVH